jgi:cytochrome P450
MHRPVILLNHPDDIAFVLTNPSRNFRKTAGDRTPVMRRLFGQGLLTSEGDCWTRQRRLAQPAFHRERLSACSNFVRNFTAQMLASWQPGEVKNVHEDSMKLTTRVVVKALFDAEAPPGIDRISEISGVILKQFTRQWTTWRILMSLFPSAGARRFEGTLSPIDKLIADLVLERRRTGVDHGDLLSMLMLARDEDGLGMTDPQLRDELVTFLIAGLETTALAVSWALYLLARNPAIQSQAAEEIQLAAKNQPAAFGSPGQCPLLHAILQETMRLYPPAGMISREAVQDCVINGLPVKKGTALLTSQWLKHRDQRYFDGPADFRPARWLDGAARQLPKFAYSPFGGGPRVCIGNNLALMEATLVLALILQRFSVSCDPDYRVAPWPSITLRPQGDICLKVASR